MDGDHRNPVTQGYICAKVRRTPEHLYGPDRLLYPARRVGPKGEGRFERISWDEALDLAAARLREARDRSGGESILPFCYGGSNGLLTQDTTDARLFHRLGASQLARTVCAAPSGRAATGLYGKMAGVAFQDFPHARLIVLWGVNPSASGIHLVPFIQEAQKAGARLVVIDPRRTPLAKKADLHLAPRPGSDLAARAGRHPLVLRERPRRSRLPGRARDRRRGAAAAGSRLDVRARGGGHRPRRGGDRGASSISTPSPRRR